MKVSVTTDEVSVDLEADGTYAPDVIRDLCARAVELVQTIAALDTVEAEDE